MGQNTLRRTLQLDERGAGEIVIPTDILLKERDRDALVTIRCTVTDQSRRSQSATLTTYLYCAAFRIFVSADKDLHHRGEWATARIKTEDLKWRPVSVNVQVALQEEV